MHVWYHLSTIFKQRYALRTVGLLSLCVALTTTLLFANVSHATTGVNQTLSFQGRLQSSNGAVVPDGNYNIQFKLYQDGDGTTAGDTGGSLKWTESYVNNGGTDGVEVKDGFFSVNLGSKTAFGTSVDWNQDTLWLSMNVAGSATGCTTFNSGSCTADGEMLPMKRITSTPYAINSGQLGGLTSAQYLQLAQGVQDDASTNSSSIFINKTGSGGSFLSLQESGTDMFNLNTNGDITLGGDTNHFVGVGGASAGNAGSALALVGGNGGSGSGSDGGSLILQGGTAGGTDANGGNIFLDSGTGVGNGSDGFIALGASHASSIYIGSVGSNISQNIIVGANNTAGSATNVTIGAGGSASSGTTAVQSKDDTTLSTNGTQRARLSGSGNTLYLGNANSSGQATTGTSFAIQGTNSTGSNVQGGSLTLQSGAATNGDANGGNLMLQGGSGSGSGANGLVVINTPTFQAASTQTCASNCTITQSNVDGNGVVSINASANNLTVTMNDPTNTTAGRIVYVTATAASHDFKLSVNSGDLVTLHAKSTATMVWNGSDWTVAGVSSNTTLQDIYDSTLQSGGSAQIVLSNNGGTANGLTIKDSSTSPSDGTLLSVQDSNSASLLSVNGSVLGVSNIQVGTGTGGGTPTLLTLDSGSSAPSVSSAMLGSMYYDTTLGEVQCYEASGWGDCSAKPDSFITLSPEYSNAVTHGSNSGVMTEDLCSDTLHINDGSSAQPTVCDSNETYNYYDWTSSDPTTNQTRSIYVTYQLPSTFKNFVSGGTSLMGRTDNSDSNVSYQVYRNNSSSGLIACGSAVSVSSGSQSSWQKGTSSGGNDPSSCSFAAGDSIVFKIDLTAKNSANAYVSNLNFAFSNN